MIEMKFGHKIVESEKFFKKFLGNETLQFD